MKTMREILESLWYKWFYFSFIKFRPGVSPFNGRHDCSLNALMRVMPFLRKEEVKRAFSACCELWPYGGVTNREFNIVLRFLRLLGVFEYRDDDNKITNDFLKKKKEIFILLVHGHFTVVSKGKIVDTVCFISRDAVVYCSWQLIR